MNALLFLLLVLHCLHFTAVNCIDVSLTVPDPCYIGVNASIRVSLSEAAPAAGASVTLSIDKPVGTFDGEETKIVTFVDGERDHYIQFLPTMLSKGNNVQMTATLSDATATTISFTVLGSVTLILSYEIVDVGTDVLVTIVLSTPATNGLTVALLTTPNLGTFVGGDTVKFAPGESAKVVTLTTTTAETGTVVATVSGSDAALYEAGEVALTVLRRVTVLLPSPMLVIGSDVRVTVQLSEPARIGLFVMLSSTPLLGTFEGDTTVDLFFAAGESIKFVTLTPTTATSGFLESILTGDDSALYSSRLVELTVQRRTVTLTLSTTTMVVGTDAVVTVELSEAPPSDVTVTLSMTPQLGFFAGETTVSLMFATGQKVRTTMLSLTATSTAPWLLTGTVSGTDAALYGNTQIDLTALSHSLDCDDCNL